MRICDKCIHNKVCLLSKSRAACELFDESRPHGEWIYKNGKYWCSSCGDKAIYHSHIQAPLPHLTNFCPNCGARMKEGDEK